MENTRMRSNRIVMLINALFSLWLVGCQSADNPPDKQPSDGDWEVGWSYTGTINLIGGNPGSSTSQWKSILESNTGYKVLPHYWDQANLPSDLGWTWSNLSNNVSTFVQQFYVNEGIVGNPPEFLSYLFGVHTPAGTQGPVLGVTFRKGDVANVYGVAVSLVLRAKISTLPFTSEQKWRITQQVVLHELGHARGLNADNGEYDHTHHSSWLGDCLMRNVESAADNHIFCPFHQQVLRECLKRIQTTYDPTAQCTY